MGWDGGRDALWLKGLPVADAVGCEDGAARGKEREQGSKVIAGEKRG